ncbi:hypothetical protein Nmel_009866, partial [Mimus melanotis]
MEPKVATCSSETEVCEMEQKACEGGLLTGRIKTVVWSTIPSLLLESKTLEVHMRKEISSACALQEDSSMSRKSIRQKIKRKMRVIGQRDDSDRKRRFALHHQLKSQQFCDTWIGGLFSFTARVAYPAALIHPLRLTSSKLWKEHASHV